MERCPVCDAPTRPGAKFCTACGARLPETDAPPDQFDAPADLVVDAAPVWPAPSTAEPIVTETILEESAIAARWPQSGGWDASWPAEAEAPPADAVLSPPAEPPQFAGEDWPAAPVEVEPYVAPAMAAPEIGPEPTSAPGESGEPDETAPEPAVEADTGGDEVVTNALLNIIAPETLVSDRGARAMALVDELRDLLPRLGQGSSFDPTRLADLLEANLTASGAHRAALRAALEDVRGRPRDVDAILQLSRRVDDVLALIDDHERLTGAVRGVVATLRGAPISPDDEVR
ncbi:MAG: hypothetical protein IT337_06215 [Thermomicrobiales bacterium]|nr:hypothetical protein [Thermomicrobiales bacterium]